MNRPESLHPDQGPASETTTRAKVVGPSSESGDCESAPGRANIASPQSERRMVSPLQEGELSERQVTQYLSEVFGGATNLSIRVKDAARAQLRPLERLPELHRLLLEKHIWGAQIRYSLRAAEWTDTLVVTHSGARVVRVRH